MGGVRLQKVSVSGGSTVYASSSDWFIVLFASAVTDQSENFRFDFTNVN